MAKQGAKAAVPKLRFPEFRENGAWKSTRLDNVLKFQVGFPFPSKGFSEETLGLRLIRNRDLRSNDKPIYFIEPYSPDFVVSDGDVLVGMDGDFTPCVWNGGDALLNQRVGRVLPKAENNKRFMLYFLTAQLKKIEESTARTTVKHLSHSDVEKICEPLPHGEEQQKIADCLTSLDEVIAAQGRKVEVLKAHKRGLMQQFFPREGETRPRLRFPEFCNAPEWKPTPLGRAFLRITNGKANAQDHEAGGAYPLFDRSEVIKASNDFAFSAEAVILPGEGMAFRPRHFEGKFNLHQRAYALMECQGNAKYFFYALDHAKGDLALKAVKSTVLSLRLPIIEKFVVYAPEEKEQRRIATCLSTIDAWIVAESSQLVALKTHKQGLMQQLFPTPENGP